MKGNLIIRKRHLLGMTMLAMMLGLSGCAPQVTTQTYTHEAGEELPAEAAAYAEFENSEQAETATVDVSKVDADNVGTYDATIMLNEREYPFTVEVVDTTAPDGTFERFMTTVGVEGKVTADSFGIKATDASEFKHGFRNAEMVKTEEEVQEILSGIVENLDITEKINVEEELGLSWKQETDTWHEKDVTWESIDEEYIPKESGLYHLEFVSVDSSGNAEVMNCYVLADLVAPVFTQIEDTMMTASNEIDAFMQSFEEKIEAEDNILGNVKSWIQVTDWNALSESNGSTEMKYEYRLTDLAGNITTAERVITVKWKGYATQGTEIANGHDRAKAEQAFAQVNQQRVAAGLHELAWDESLYEFACTRSTQIVTDFSHNIPDGTDVAKHLLYNVGGANGYGENIARNYKSINNLINGWMNSQGHKENILDSRYTAGVMACYCCNGTYYWVNLFKAQ